MNESLLFPTFVKVLQYVIQPILQQVHVLLQEQNQLDLDQALTNGLSPAMIDRLTLSDKVIEGMAIRTFEKDKILLKVIEEMDNRGLNCFN